MFAPGVLIKFQILLKGSNLKSGRIQNKLQRQYLKRKNLYSVEESGISQSNTKHKLSFTATGLEETSWSMIPI